MEWEKKFYDIIQETESNLAKAKHKLLGRSLLNSHNPADFFGSSQRGVSSFEPWLPMSYMNSNKHNTSSHSPLDGTLGTWSGGMPTTTGYATQTQSSEMGRLLTTVDSQKLMIDRLERLVRTLNQEKDQYRKHITDLQKEVGDISCRLGDSRYMKPHLETQVDLMRHEVRSDIQRLQSTINGTKERSLYSDQLHRSFTDMQRSMNTEMDLIRRDLNAMTHRVGRLELDVSSHSINQRDGQDRLSASVRSPSYSTTSLGNQTSWMKTGVSPIQDLRSTVTQLHGKLDSLESRIAASRTAAAPTSSSGDDLQRAFAKKYSQPVKFSFDHIDDDDSSDLSLSLSDDTVDLTSDNLSEELNEIIKSRKTSSAVTRNLGDECLGSPDDYNTVSVAEMKSSVLDDADLSWEGTELSDLDLDNLDLSSAGNSVDLDAASSVDLQLDDL